MKIRFFCTTMCMFFLFMVAPVNSFATVNEVYQQSITVKGKVTDNAGEPLPGVSIILKGSTTGVMTDIDGNYSINVPNSNAVLTISYMGFVPQEHKVGNNTTLNIVLVEQSTNLDEVVVVGYGVQKKINLTGSVASVDSKKLENRAVTNLATSISGLAPGVRVTQGSGNPGSESVSITFRGTTSLNGNSPLVLVDGVVADMNVINNEDVESINFLKDAASAAIYGSRAAAGVILVTTKKGKREKPRVTISSMLAHAKPISDLSFMSNMVDYMNYHNVGSYNASGNGFYSQERIDEWAAANANPNGIYTDPTTGNQIPNWLAYPNTDWAKILFDGYTYHKQDVSVSGGTENSTYMLSLGYQNNPGSLVNTGLERYNMRANVETKIADFITFGTQTYATKEFKEPGSTDNTYLFQAYPGINPVYQGKYGASEDPMMTSMNNVLRSAAATGGKNDYMRINTTWYANAKIWDGLTAEAKFNYNEYNRADKTYSRNLPSYRFRLGTGSEGMVENLPNITNATSYRYHYKSYSYTTNLILRYNKSFGNHDIGAFIGHEQYYYNSSGFSATKKTLLDWDITDITSTVEMQSIGGSAETDYAVRSIFGRLNYAYKNKYMFEMNLRSDASSRFAPNNRGHVFPSFSAAWRPSEESFFEPILPVVNSLKLRASYGELGNTVSGNYEWQETYAQTKGVFNGQISNGLVLSSLPNYAMTWETTSTINLGLDAMFFKNRLGLEFDWYYRKTTDMLLTTQIPITMGNVTAPMSNQGELTNKGVDIALNWNDKIGKDFRYSLGFNMNYNKNEITKYKGALIYGLDESLLDVHGNPTWRYLNFSAVSNNSSSAVVEGHMINEHYIRQVYKGNGTYTNADGTVNPNGGPKDGMIRTKADLDWAKAMIAAGYQFNSGTTVGPGSSQIWYGELLMADINGDGKYGDSNDRVFTGKSSAPKVTFGLNMSAEWKGVDFNALWSGRLGSYSIIYSRGVNAHAFSEATDALPSNAGSLFYSYDHAASVNDPNYDPANDSNANITAKYPRLYAGTSQTQTSSDYYLFNTSFLKLKSLQIGYTLPKKWITPAKIEKCRIYVAGENLLTIKDRDFPGVDPEFGGTINAYPIARMYSVGINLTF
ncbi:MAG: TonB-dependent receptor [Prevotella sp.]|nr:TonB-dependent receptor [Prevotella sp.]